MRLSEIRSELLREHQQIRALAHETLDLAEHAGREPEAQRALCDSLARLESSVWHHNRHEEELLDHVLPTVDAWGPERAQRMSAHHDVEYEATFEALAEARCADGPSRACAIVRDLLDHIAHEEEEFLCQSVLDEDGFDLGAAFGG